MIARITKAYERSYSDNGQTKVYVEYIDNRGQHGRTEGRVMRGEHCPCCGKRSGQRYGSHMQALVSRAAREGIALTRENW